MKRSNHRTLLGSLVLNGLLWSGMPLAAQPLAAQQSTTTAKAPTLDLQALDLGSNARSLKLEPAVTQAKQSRPQRAEILNVNGTLTPANETLQDGTYFEAHTFSGRAGQEVDITLSSSDFDAYLLLIDPDGNLIAENDDINPNNFNSRIQTTLPGNGTYLVVANTVRPQEQGSYNLSMTTALGSGAFQATLSWNTIDDLDVSVRDPDGNIVSFGEPVVASGGQLDVDSNSLCAGVTSTPVENIFWPANGAPQGEYAIVVHLYQHCGSNSGPVPFTLQLNVQGTIETFEGMVDASEDGQFAVFSTAVY
ncbi:MAG: pre-peptidase C-terminal domain-containing protein [Geitlerinemataceae cyanobacterium]